MSLSDEGERRRRDHLREQHGIGGFASSLKEIVYGGNDGIITTFAVVAGFAGANATGTETVAGVAVLLFGLANLFADATSMGMSDFLSSRSERDRYRANRRAELREIRDRPRAEKIEVVQILTDRGVSHRDARAFADLYARNPELMADFMMRYEFAMDDPSDARPWVDGLTTFASFMLFGTIPLLPYFIFEAVPSTFWYSLGATGVALLLLGLLRFHVTREGLIRSVGETVLVGGVCALVAYAVGLSFRM